MSDIREISLRDFLRNPKVIFPIPTIGIIIKCRDREDFKIIPMSDIPTKDVRPSVTQLRETIAQIEQKEQTWGNSKLFCQICRESPVKAMKYSYEDGTGEGEGYFCKRHTEEYETKKLSIQQAYAYIETKPADLSTMNPQPKPKKKEKKRRYL